MRGTRRRTLLTVGALIGALLVGFPGGAPPAAAGIDSDGFADLVFANSTAQANEVCYSDGSSYTCVDVNGDLGESSTDVALGDIDGDGDLDGVFSNAGDPLTVCTDVGTALANCTNHGTTVNGHGVALGDVDRDGDLDAVIAVLSAANRVCLNNGAGTFTCADVSAEVDASRGVALGDLDGDGFLDALFANDGQEERVCLNDGDQTFTCADATIVTVDSQDVVLGDVDNDGDLDAFVSVDGDQNRLCLNNGDGTFASCAAVDLAFSGGHRNAALADFDWDGDLDAVVAATDGNLFCDNDGTGSFTCAALGVGGLSNEDVAAGDINEDGWIDVVMASTAENRECLNDGDGTFTCTDVSASTDTTLGVAIAPPVHNLDAVFAVSSSAARSRLCVGGGDGTSFQCNDVSNDIKTDRDVAIADLNHDGLDDIVIARFLTEKNPVCLNDGDGTFTCSLTGGGSYWASGVALGDFDNDGHIDAAFSAFFTGSNEVCFNNGSGGLAACDDLDSGDFTAVAAGDFDEDGSLDLLYAQFGLPLRMCLNDGTGVFTCGDRGPSVVHQALAVGDVDGDGDLDAVIAVAGTANQVCLGDGAGGLTCSDIDAQMDGTWAIALADFDGDGDLDVVSGNQDASGDFCENNGSGTFSCTNRFFGNAEDIFDIAVADIDNDGDMDFMAADGEASDPHAHQSCVNNGTGLFTCTTVDIGPVSYGRGVAVGNLGMPNCAGSPGSIEGTAGSDNIVGTGAADVIVSWAGNDVVNGGGGNDWICLGSGNDLGIGGEGDDKIYGEDGDDTLVGSNGLNDLFGGDGSDTGYYADDPSAIVADLQAGTVDHPDRDLVDSLENIVGSIFDDDITGDGEDNSLLGLAGNDTIDGGPGDDRIEGGPGDDVLDGGDGNDTATHGSSSANITADLYNGTATGEGTDSLTRFENLTGGSGHDTIIGDEGDNTLLGGGGDDTLYPVGGTDFMDGEGGSNSVETDFENDGATVMDPIEVNIAQISAPGQVSITLGAPGADPAGFEIFGTAVSIVAPAVTAEDPLQFGFLLDSTLVDGPAAADVVVFKDGVEVADCVGDPGEADPDPCVFLRDTAGDDVEVGVYSSTASEWAFGVESVPSVVRYSGSNRFGTAADVSVNDFSDAGSVDTVFLAVGNNFPDALAGAAVAGKLGAPLLLVNTGAPIPGETLAELNRLEPATIVILGGTAVISDAVETELEGLGFAPTVVRLAGANRYATAVEISKYGFPVDGSAVEVLVATGTGFPDALAGGPAAVALGGPVLLTDPNGLSGEVADEIERLAPDRIVVLGGTAVVSAGVVAQLEALDGSPLVIRLAGANRYETAVAISEEAFGAGAMRVYLATGLNFPDALAGAAAAAFYGAPVLLVPGTDALVPQIVEDEVIRLGAFTGIIVGGTSVVSAGIETDLGDIIGVT